MAAEVLATEKVAEGLVAEIKANEDIINVAQESPSQSKDLEEKVVEEKLKEGSLGIVLASAAGSEERPENEKSDPVAEDVKEKDVKVSNSKILASDIAEKGEITKHEYDSLAVEPLAEVHEELKNSPDDTDSSQAEETSDKHPENANVVPAEAPPLDELDENVSGVVDECVEEENSSVMITNSCPVTESTEDIVKPEDNFEEEMQEKAKLVEERTLSKTLETDNAAEVTQISSECSQGVKRVDKEKGDTSQDIIETSEIVDAANEVSLPEGEKGSKVEGENGSGGAEVAEKKNETVEGENTTLVGTARDVDVEGLKVTSRDGEDTITEVPAKTPRRQGNNLFSKMKQSIVKVKKAIVGKSTNSKTVTAEGNGDTKVK